MAFKILSKIFLVIFLFDRVLICSSIETESGEEITTLPTTTEPEEEITTLAPTTEVDLPTTKELGEEITTLPATTESGEEITTLPATTQSGEEITTGVEIETSTVGELLGSSDTFTMTTMTTTEDEACTPSQRKKRNTYSVSEAEMALAIRLEWERENFYDGEMAEYYEENSITEWDLYSFFHDVAKGSMSDEFTMIKAIFQNVTFKQDLNNVESDNYLDLRSQLISLINSINDITNQSLLSSEIFQMALFKTDDCLVKFILYIPWNLKTSEVKKLGDFFDFAKINII